MAAQTQTLTATKPAQLSLPLRLDSLEDSVRKKVGVLLEEMQKSSLFTAQTLASWKVEFDKAPLKTPEELDAAPLMLCYLLCEIVRPAITNAGSNGELAILHFEDEICSILQLILPKDEKVDAFIEQFEVYSKEAHRLQKQSQEVDALFQKKMEELDHEAERGGETFAANFEEHKVSLLESVQQQEDQTDKLHDKVDALGEKMNTAHDKLLHSAQKMHTLAQDLQKEQEHLQQVAKTGLALLDEVRRL